MNFCRLHQAGGNGLSEGLFDSPVSLVIMPEACILVPENGGARVQAFDVYGNPVALLQWLPVNDPIARRLRISQCLMNAVESGVRATVTLACGLELGNLMQ